MNKQFFHPGGVLGSRQFSLLEVASKSKNEVVQKGLLSLNKTTPLDYQSRVIKNVDIGAYGKGKGHDEFVGDSMQVYQQVLMYVITKNDRYAKKAVGIVNDWIQGCQSFTGSNAPLECAWGGCVMVRGIELLKYTYPGWNKEFEKLFNSFLDKIIIPNLENRYKEIVKWNNNWVLTIQEARIQIAIFKEDRTTFNTMIEEFKKSFNCCVFDCGMNTEIKRDQIHSQFQIGSIINICEMAWHQGIDLYSDKVMKCMEFQAFILNGNIPPEVKKEDLKDVWFMPSSWEIGYNHFRNRKKYLMPETGKLLVKNRPERLTFCWGPGWTHYEG